MSSTGHREEFRRHSGWWIPGAFLLALAVICGLLLGWYLRPGVRPPNAPTEQSGLVWLKLHGTSFAIPANAIEDAAARAGGDRNAVTLAVLFPSWRGYSADTARMFDANAPDSPLVRLSLHGGADGLDAHDRLNRLYRPHITASDPAPFGLTRYTFAPQSGYGDTELFAGETKNSLFLFLCERGSPQFSSPNCSSVDRTAAPGLNYSYRFKRAYLGRWQELAAGADRLITQFRRPDTP